MKRLLFILLLALLPIGAHAANCKPPGTQYIHAGKMGEHWWIYWWCPDGTWQWSTQSPPQYTAAGVEAGTAFYLGFDSPPVPMLPPDDVLAQLRAGVEAAVAADTVRPPPPKTGWFVADNGNPDRPMYPVTDGVRGTKATGERATVGDKCRCEAPYRIDEGRTTYCALDARVPFAFTVDAFSVSVCREVK